METESLNLLIGGAIAVAASIPQALFAWWAFSRETKAKRLEATIEYQRTYERLLFESKLRVAEASMAGLVQAINHYQNMILILDKLAIDLPASQAEALGKSFDENLLGMEKLAGDFENIDRSLLGLHFDFALPEYLRLESKQALTDEQLRIHALADEFRQWDSETESLDEITEEMWLRHENIEVRWNEALKGYKDVAIKVFSALHETADLIKAELRSGMLPSTNTSPNCPKSRSIVSKP